MIHCFISCFKEARSSYRKILTESARKLNAQGSQLGACIEKARPYYEARRLAKEVRKRVLSFPKHVAFSVSSLMPKYLFRLFVSALLGNDDNNVFH